MLILSSRFSNVFEYNGESTQLQVLWLYGTMMGNMVRHVYIDILPRI